MATGVAMPLLNGPNHRTYDWEAQFQINYYFGAGGFGGRRTPNLN